VDAFRHELDLRRPVDLLEPSALPEDEAAGLTSSVGMAITTEAKMVSILQMSPRIMPADRIAGLVRALVNAKTLTAVFEHLRHKREPVEASILVERPEDALLAQDLYPVACTRFHANVLSSRER
jgi:hypothetical protein